MLLDMTQLSFHQHPLICFIDYHKLELIMCEEKKLFIRITDDKEKISKDSAFYAISDS